MRWLAPLIAALAVGCAARPVNPDVPLVDGPSIDSSDDVASDVASSESTDVSRDDVTIAPDGGGRCSGMAPQCDGLTGLCNQSPLCSAAMPCMNALVGVMRQTLTTPLTMPNCRTNRMDRMAFNDGAPRTWMTDGVQRAACVFTPSSATAATPRPLLIYLHGAGGSADAIYDSSSLRAKAVTYDLAGDGRAGFILASHQGRNQVNENGNPPASRHDLYYRTLDGPTANSDIKSLDTLIDTLVATGTVDRRRIHLTGWSNGAFFAQSYALRRYNAPTPGGNRVASVAVFDGADPFQSPRPDLVGCELRDVPRAPLPVMIVHRACSTVGCNAAQRTSLSLPLGFDVTTWVARLRTEIGATPVEDRVVLGNGMLGPCAAACAMGIATIQHVQWPDGVADRSGIDHEPAMLDFLRMHPLR